VLSENLPTGPLKKLVTKTILKLEESENLINDIESGGFQIETPTGLFGRAKIGPKAYFIKLVDAYLNTSPLVGFWNRPNRCRFISNLGIYVESVRLNKEIRNQLDALFLDDYYSSSAGLENFRIGLEKIAPSLGCSMDLAMLLAIGKNSLSSSKSTNPEEIVFGKNAHYLTNPYRILGFDSQPTKQQVMAAVLQQMKKNPQDLVTIRLAQSSLFDALSGPVFAFLYCFHRSAADLETKATQHKEVPVNRSPNLTETAGGAV
jgi:hypothetical protein